MNRQDVNLAKAICGYCAAALIAIVLTVSLGLVQAQDEADAQALKAQQRALAQNGGLAK